MSIYEYYLVIPDDSFDVEGVWHDPSCPDGPTHPDPTKRLVPVDPDDLGPKTPQELMRTHIPQISGDPPEITSWEPKPALNEVLLAVDGPAKDDLSNFATFTIGDGPVNGDYTVITSRQVSCDKPDCRGSLEHDGNGTFKVKVYGPGDIKVQVVTDHLDYSNPSITLSVIPGDF